ncbi:hypothetical protein [Pseudodesulfovibrio tunisiensis]|uniref:hypothetical protein n=1 Tax=Pseudodesulfovibrio tunisiensis TaxID=463192 RepID=UPI001FB3DE93|nr:hypothetical protein [Pseudodesulfovibrio tunisiensis]
MSDLPEQPLTPQEIEERKRFMYEKMSPRRRKFVDRIGYDKWDPFAAPFDPIDIRTDTSGHTAHQLTQLFIRDMGSQVNQEFIDAVSEFNVMLCMNFEKVRPIYEYCLWYSRFLEKQGIKL